MFHKHKIEINDKINEYLLVNMKKNLLIIIWIIWIILNGLFDEKYILNNNKNAESEIIIFNNIYNEYKLICDNYGGLD